MNTNSEDVLTKLLKDHKESLKELEDNIRTLEVSIKKYENQAYIRLIYLYIFLIPRTTILMKIL